MVICSLHNFMEKNVGEQGYYLRRVEQKMNWVERPSHMIYISILWCVCSNLRPTAIIFKACFIISYLLTGLSS